jgi:hypothetical protein
MRDLTIALSDQPGSLTASAEDRPGVLGGVTRRIADAGVTGADITSISDRRHRELQLAAGLVEGRLHPAAYALGYLGHELPRFRDPGPTRVDRARSCAVRQEAVRACLSPTGTVHIQA